MEDKIHEKSWWDPKRDEILVQKAMEKVGNRDEDVHGCMQSWGDRGGMMGDSYLVNDLSGSRFG